MRLAVLLSFVALTACHKQERPPAPSAEQADQLNDASDMLNAMAQNEEGLEANASSPSNSSD
jgi:hypothetical protein